MTGQDSAEILGGHPGVKNVLQGSGPGGATFRLRLLGPAVSYGKGGIRDAHRFTATASYHRESGASGTR